MNVSVQTDIKEQIDETISSVPALRQAGSSITETLHSAVLGGGEGVRGLVDVLHGTWLGHPLHPVLTDVTIGAWTMGAVFDALAALADRRRDRLAAQQAADTLLTIGTTSALATALTGIADYSAIKRDAVAHATLHGSMNMVGFVLFVLSLLARRSGNRQLGVGLSGVSLGMLGISAWIGGELVYRHRVGVNHAPNVQQPQSWTDVMGYDQLAEGTPRRVQVNGHPVLLYRSDNRILAVSAVCSHAGGPLDEGKFEGMCVQCPWHDSVFDLRTGSVVHGPATYNQPNYETRTMNGQIQVRVPQRTGAPS